MAWRIHEHVSRAIIDNRVRGKVTGTVWLAGRPDPLRLQLEGNAWPDLAGCLLKIENPAARPGSLEALATDQSGVCGDLTASRKVKIPTVEVTAWSRTHPGEPLPFVWANAVYLEWFSEPNGRVVIELSGCRTSLTAPEWRLTPEEAGRQSQRAAEAMAAFLQPAGGSGASSPPESAADSAAADPGDTDAGCGPAIQARIDRIEDLKREARELSGGTMMSGGDENLPLDLRERFWENVLAFERCAYRTERELLAEDGITLPPPESLFDEALREHLARVIDALARRHSHLEQTDHLSDRELYTVLVERILEEETEVLPPDSGWCNHIVVSDYGVPGGSDDGIELYLRYYADEETRNQWAADFPDDPMPPHEDPPYDRDRWLPKPPGVSPGSAPDW